MFNIENRPLTMEQILEQQRDRRRFMPTLYDRPCYDPKSCKSSEVI